MMSLVIFLLLLVALILVHEFGHFIVAKLFGIRVDEFSIFFPPRIAAWHWGDTQLSLGALPFGGYVKIFGENPDDASSGASSFDRQNFSHRSRWIQAAVIVAGIVCNILAAWLLLSGAYMVGMQTSVDHVGIGQVQNPKATIVDVLPGSPAQKAGIAASDVVVGIDTGSASLPSGASASAVQQFIAAHQDESMVISVERAGQEEHLLAKPAEGVISGHKALGIELDDLGLLKLSPPLALVQGAVLAWSMTSATAVGLATFFGSVMHGTANFAGIAGPVGIATLGSSAVKAGVVKTIILTSLISINLALINLIPVPGLDGGRLLFIAIEGVLRRPISEKLASRLTIAGFALLIALMLLVTYHDILHLVHPA